MFLCWSFGNNVVLLDFKKIVMNWSRPPFHPQQGGGGGGGTPIWKGQWCSSEILNLTPKRDQSECGGSHITNQNPFFLVISSRATLNETLTAKNNDILPITPWARPKSEIYTPKRDDEHPRPFQMGVPRPQGFPHARTSGISHNNL